MISRMMSNNSKKKESGINLTITKKSRDKPVKARIRRAIKHTELFHQFTENEFSNKDFFKNIKVKSNSSKIPKKTDSSQSVIYMGTSYQIERLEPGCNNLPMIDLTNTRENSYSKENFTNSKQLRTIFFPNRNFERVTKLKKHLTTSSLVTLPVFKKPELKKQYSTTDIEQCKSKLSVLDLPPEFLRWEDLDFNDINIMKKAELSPSDHEMIQLILDIENHNFNSDINMPSSIGSGSSSTLNSDMSIEDMVSEYNISSEDYI